MKGSLQFPIEATTAEKQMLAQLHRLTGGRLHVQKREVKDDELSLKLDEPVSIRFMNRGEFPVLIDNQVLLYPNETYVEGDTAGPGLDHTYQIEFQKMDANRAPLGNPEPPFLYPGRHLCIRSLHRKY